MNQWHPSAIAPKLLQGVGPQKHWFSEYLPVANHGCSWIGAGGWEWRLLRRMTTRKMTICDAPRRCIKGNQVACGKLAQPCWRPSQKCLWCVNSHYQQLLCHEYTILTGHNHEQEINHNHLTVNDHRKCSGGDCHVKTTNSGWREASVNHVIGLESWHIPKIRMVCLCSFGCGSELTTIGGQ